MIGAPREADARVPTVVFVSPLHQTRRPIGRSFASIDIKHGEMFTSEGTRDTTSDLDRTLPDVTQRQREDHDPRCEEPSKIQLQQRPAMRAQARKKLCHRSMWCGAADHGAFEMTMDQTLAQHSKDAERTRAAEENRQRCQENMGSKRTRTVIKGATRICSRKVLMSCLSREDPLKARSLEERGQQNKRIALQRRVCAISHRGAAAAATQAKPAPLHQQQQHHQHPRILVTGRPKYNDPLRVIGDLSPGGGMEHRRLG